MQKETNSEKTAEYINSVETSLTIIGIRKDGILEIRFKLNEYEVGVNDQLDFFETNQQWTHSIPYTFSARAIWQYNKRSQRNGNI